MRSGGVLSARCNEDDAEKVFGIKAPGVNVLTGNVEAEKYRQVAQELVKGFPNLKKVAITLRGSVSASTLFARARKPEGIHCHIAVLRI